MILYEENLIEKSLTEMKKAEEMLYIWGTGELGAKIGRFLTEKGIDFQGYVIDKRYADGRSGELLGHPVYVLEDYMQDHIGELIVAFAGYTGKLPGEGIRDNVKKVYALDFMGVLVIEEENVLTKKSMKRIRRKYSGLKITLQMRNQWRSIKNI